MQRNLLAALAVLLLAAGSAHAADAPINQPDLISIGGGYLDFDKSEPNKKSGDIRLEYRWGLSILSAIDSDYRNWDSDVQFHPFVGFETTTRGALYGLGGFAMDWYISKHAIFTWSEGFGAFDQGNGPRMGCVCQFRSQAELGWRFDNDIRLTGQFSHISDAKITNFNPGAEIIGAYVHIPVGMIFGGK